MNATFVREVELAYRLGFTEMEDFRRALGRGDVLPPAMYLGTGRKRCPLWDPDEVNKWLQRDTKKAQESAVNEAVNGF